MTPALRAATGAWATLGRWLAAWAAAARRRLDDRVRELAEHPARLVWTALVTAALFAAVWPVLHYARGFWMHGMSWGFLVNRQNDYGEGPLFNQQVILYHLLFDRADPLYRGMNIYQLGEHPPFSVGNYPPVFPLLAAVLMRFVGMTFTAGRLISTLSILGSAILVGLIVWQGTGQVLPGILGFGILITMRNGIWSWGPYNRVDSLALFWSMLTVFLVLRYAGTRKVWWAVPAAILTVYTRQSMLDGIFAAYCYLLVRDWRRALAVAGVTAAAGMLIFILLQIWTHGAFYLNTVVDNENAFSFGGALGAWHRFIGGEGRFAFPLAVAGAAAGLFGTGSILWAIWLAGSVFVFATIGKTGAASNYYFTLEAATAACAGLFVGRFRTFFRGAPFPLWPLEILLPGMLFVYVHGTAPRWLPRSLPIVGGAMSLTGEALSHSPAAATANTRYCSCWAGHENTAAVDYLRTVSGPVLAIDFPHADVVQAGHIMQWQPFEFSVAYADGTWNPAPFVEAIADRYYAVVITTHQLGGYIGGAASGAISTALETQYHYDRSVGGYQVYARNSPPTVPPPTVPEPVPHPLPDLGRFAVHALVGAPGMIWSRLSARVLPVHLLDNASFAEANLRPHLNLIGVETPNVPSPDGQGFDGDGNFLSTADGFPSPGTHQYRALGASVPLYVPPAGSHTPSVMNLSSPVRVALPAGKDRAVWLLESAGNGPQTAPVTLEYARGAPTRQTVSFTDWCAPPGPNEAIAFRGAARLNAQAQVVAPACGMFVMRLVTDPTRVLDAIRFGSNMKVEVAAITVQRA